MSPYETLVQRKLRARLNNFLIYVDSSESIYFKNFSIYDIFKFNSTFIKDIPANAEFTIPKQTRPFALRGYTPTSSCQELSNLFDLIDATKSAIQIIISKLKLPKHFNCLHIRRGDKLNRDSLRYEFEEYFNKVKYTNINSVFIMTDDFSVIQETKTYVQQNNLNINLFYLTQNNQNGNFTKRKLLANYAYSKEELLNFLAELEIAKNSEYFVGTESSNVFRFVKSTCPNSTRFITLD